MALITLNGTDAVVSKLRTFQVEIFDLDSEDTGRNAKGEMVRSRITVKTKLSFDYAPLTSQEASQILTAIAPEFIDVTYPDPKAGQSLTKKFYAGNRTAPCLYQTGGGSYLWQGISFTLTEQ